MPLIKLKHVVSFSSEDNAHPTSNLLKSENFRKWRCAEPGEKQAVVVLEFEKATKIHSIDIGNNGSALIEVLVGRSSDSSENFKVILVTSSFMSPTESKSFTNTNRVRMFGPDKLSKPVADEKWDRVKLVCTQPFNKYERYGLSFVSLHSPPEDTSEENKDIIPTPKRLGSFTLRDEEDDSIAPGSLFFKKKMKSPPTASTAALVRDASSSSPSDKTSVGDIFKNRQPVASKPKEEKKPIPGDTSSSEESSNEEEERNQQSTSHKMQPSSSPLRNESKSDHVSKNSPQKEDTKSTEDKNEQKGKSSIQKGSKRKAIAYEGSTDDEKEMVDSPAREESASDQDTEDELEKLHKTEEKEDGSGDDVYNMSTEDEEENNEDNDNGVESGSEGLPELPDFFSNKHFLLYGEMDQPTRRSLIRYVTAYNGVLEEYMSDTVEFVITNETWDQNFEDALGENASLAFVQPKWIFTCHEKGKLVPFQPYIITPS